ncbi:MAG TPA: deoxyguanosinetriphosphate triphosphohydrolase [Firmicutes bacterium]|nr:deoxyguanosinetriphosphate triphosphohydrolase [Bacillota bacterium]
MKETVYANERNTLCERAFLSENSAGRLKPLRPCPVRTDFMRDRDRIIHSKSFRRLMHKMQVFLAPEGDHYRTRLTHTLEVTQIARTLARALRLNEDLTEAAALGHDLGHTPFGHSGERALDRLCPNGFRHYEQSLRVADKLENLNLTVEVRDGMLNHSGANRASTLEGQLIKYADRIAYINHDIDDAIRAGILKAGDLPRDLTEILGDTHSKRISTMVNAVIAYGTDGDIGMTEPHWEATMKLRSFMFENVYFNSAAKSEDSKVADMIEHIYEYFRKQPDKLPPEYQANIEEDGVERSICDYIACMTDRYALALFEELFVPKTWQHK